MTTFTYTIYTSKQFCQALTITYIASVDRSIEIKPFSYDNINSNDLTDVGGSNNDGYRVDSMKVTFASA